jgi:hypothetical protein
LGRFAIELWGLDAAAEQLEAANRDGRDREDASRGEPEAQGKKATQVPRTAPATRPASADESV